MTDVTVRLKRCPACSVDLPRDAFYGTPTRQSAYCRPCTKRKAVEWRARQDSGLLSEADRVKSRRFRLKRKYGITLDQYESMWASQDGRCAICARPEDGSHALGYRMAVDHDHETGRIRGLLCTRCNTAIGQLRDDPQLMLSAATYVLRHRRN